MKPTPLLIVAVVFGASFAGRAIGFANAALDRSETVTAQKEKTDLEHAGPLLKSEDAIEAVVGPKETKHAAVDTAEDHNTSKTDEPVSASHKAMQNNKLLQAIRERAAAIDKKESEVEDRIRVLEVLEKRIEDKLAELRQSNDDLAKLVSYASEASQKDIALLAKMYEQMKPQKAGQIFDKMNPTFTAGFLTEMNSENAALILANMSTDKAYEASMIIAGRNASASQ